MPAKDVKAYVKRNKNDAADAGAICEAVRRPTYSHCNRTSISDFISLRMKIVAIRFSMKCKHTDS